jgi:hypothetical protein
MAKAPFEIVSDKVSESDLKDEVMRRNAKAGYTTRFGEPTRRTKIMAQPPTAGYRDNYARAFGHE